MSPKKVSVKYSADTKKIIEKHGREVCVVDLACQYDQNMSTMCTSVLKTHKKFSIELKRINHISICFNRKN